MAEREVAAYLIGRRYDCDECGAEMERDSSGIVLMSNPPMYPHRCANGHEANLSQAYPGYSVAITQDPFVVALR